MVKEAEKEQGDHYRDRETVGPITQGSMTEGAQGWGRGESVRDQVVGSPAPPVFIVQKVQVDRKGDQPWLEGPAGAVRGHVSALPVCPGWTDRRLDVPQGALATCQAAVGTFTCIGPSDAPHGLWKKVLYGPHFTHLQAEA